MIGRRWLSLSPHRILAKHILFSRIDWRKFSEREQRCSRSEVVDFAS
jgi:hypothetical protein